MRKNFAANPWLYPMPVLIIGTYDEDGTPNAMNAAWGGISGNSEISICITKNHKTTKNILKNKDFTISIANVKNMAACDYVGIVSGNEVKDKVEKAGFHTQKAQHVDAPIFLELPMTLECRCKSYDPENGHLLGEIVNVCAQESILTNGQIDPLKLQAITFDPVNNAYLTLGEKAGNAFEDGNKLK